MALTVLLGAVVRSCRSRSWLGLRRFSSFRFFKNCTRLEDPRVKNPILYRACEWHSRHLRCTSMTHSANQIGERKREGLCKRASGSTTIC